MRLDSIASRLFLLSAAWLVVALVGTAFLLAELYAQALDRSLTENIDFNLETLVARALSEGEVRDVDLAAADPRFERIASGWYWQVSSLEGEVLSTSDSLIGSVMPPVSSAFGEAGRRSAVTRDDFDYEVRIIERRIDLPAGQFVFSVTGNLDDNTELTANFRSQALLVLVIVGAALAVMSALVARVALRPIEKLRAEMEEVRDGTKPDIAGSYPSELSPLATEVNTLLASNAKIVERARAQVGNLAHGLKTPIAVLRNELNAQKGAFANIVDEQLDRMSRIVTNYLDRARLAARTAIVGKRCNATESLEKLGRVMQKIHPERDVQLEVLDQVWFRGDEADFEEIVGNLFDNACKWSRSRVVVSIGSLQKSAHQFEIIITDDGEGLTQTQRREVLKRGVRLDEKVQGSGLGLDIVKELVDIYGGDLSLDQAEIGGLQVKLRLPAAKSPS